MRQVPVGVTDMGIAQESREHGKATLHVLTGTVTAD